MIFRYGILPPTENAELVRAELWKAHLYRNKLVEFERARRVEVRPALERPELEVAFDAAQAAVIGATRDIRLQRARTHSRSDSPEMRKRLSEAREAFKLARDTLFEERRSLLASSRVQRLVSAAHERANEARKKLRNSGDAPHWGTYLLAEDAADTSSKKTPLFEGLEPKDPRFRRWTGEGRLGLQIQKGMSVADAFSGTHNQLRIVRPAPRPLKARQRPSKRDHRILQIRIGSDEHRAPIFASFPIFLDRPLPAAGIIKNVHVRLRRVASREAWLATFEVAVSGDEPTKRPGAVAIDVGWRVVPDGIRVGVYTADDGASGHCVLPLHLVDHLTESDGLREIRDRQFNRVKLALTSFLHTHPSVPDWLREATQTLEDWHSPARLAGLLRRWKTLRFDGDEEVWRLLADPSNRNAKGARADWLGHDRHLWQWECESRAASRAHRKQLYRQWGKALASHYGTLVIERFDLRRVARRPSADAARAENETARRNRQLVAVSELIDCCKHAFTRAGGAWTRVAAEQSTHECHACHAIEAFDAAAYITHACSSCGEIWDQDENASAVLLGRFFERPRDAPEAQSARENEIASPSAGPRETRWARIKRLKRERLEKATPARK